MFLPVPKDEFFIGLVISVLYLWYSDEADEADESDGKDKKN